MCISPRYERLVEAVLGTAAIEDVDFVYPGEGAEEEAAIAETGLGVYLTVTGSTARDHGLVLGDHLFPSETVLMENEAEIDPADGAAKELLAAPRDETRLVV
jgi:ATP phosphoribosyltransferase